MASQHLSEPEQHVELVILPPPARNIDISQVVITVYTRIMTRVELRPTLRWVLHSKSDYHPLRDNRLLAGEQTHTIIMFLTDVHRALILTVQCQKSSKVLLVA